MEFWSTLCDEEIFLAELAEDAAASGQAPERANQRFVSQAPAGQPYSFPRATFLCLLSTQQLRSTPHPTS